MDACSEDPERSSLAELQSPLKWEVHARAELQRPEQEGVPNTWPLQRLGQCVMLLQAFREVSVKSPSDH